MYFQILCFVWAGIAIGSRIAMLMMGHQWASWELDTAYQAKRPRWVLAVAVIGFLLIVTTWYVYLRFDVPHGWVLSLLVTLTAVKLGNLLFNYDRFRVFVRNTLANPRQKRLIDASVLALAVGLMIIGVFLY